MNELLKIMESRRSVRKYTGEKVSEQHLYQILQAGLLSPSGRGIRPWKFIAIKDKATLEELANARIGAADMLKNADCAIVVIADPDKTDVWIEDCSIAMAYMHLMADSLGLGSCWIQGRLRDSKEGNTSDEYVKRLLGYPKNFTLEAILSIGIPFEKRSPYPLPDIAEPKVHFEKY